MDSIDMRAILLLGVLKSNMPSRFDPKLYAATFVIAKTRVCFLPFLFILISFNANINCSNGSSNVLIMF